MHISLESEVIYAHRGLIDFNQDRSSKGEQNIQNEEKPWIVPLYNFDSDIGSLRLDETICFRRKRKDELPDNLVIRLDTALKIAIDFSEYVLEFRMRNFDFHELERIIFALRLMGSGDVKAYNAIRLAHADEKEGSMILTTFYSQNVYSARTYFLKGEASRNLADIWKKLRDVASKEYLDFPLRLFMNTYETNIPVEKIVDYMTIFESLTFYGRDKAIEPAGEVIGIALGMMLGKDEHERSEMKEILTEAYRVRNARVHGNLKKLPQPQEIAKLAMKVEDCVRFTLRKFVEE